MTSRMRILMVCHMPWDRNLGGPRVQVELADEFRAAGHTVEKFSYEDAFPRGRGILAECMDSRAFPRAARSFIQEKASEYDVIDAHQGNLPFPKRALNFSGLLVARSVGLYDHYAAFAREEAVRWPGGYRGTWAGRALRTWRDWRSAPTFPRSLRAADLINVCNDDELAYVRDALGMGEKCVALPFGMSPARCEAFATADDPPADRLTRKEVVFIGAWGVRKGSLDWGAITTGIRAAVPGVQIRFLGTHASPNRVLEDLGIGASDDIRVTPTYDSNDLPELLRGAAVGLFPSYIEGFPFALLEKLAAGLPVVAYDVPGSRETLRQLGTSFLVAPGDTNAIVARARDVLTASHATYTDLSRRCRRIAERFRWDRIAAETLAIYRERLAACG